MSGGVFALVVGINDHGGRVDALAGCLNNVVHDQGPVGYAVPPASMDEPTLGGVVQPRPPGARLERYRDRWWIDVGSVHGIQPPLDGRTTSEQRGEAVADVPLHEVGWRYRRWIMIAPLAGLSIGLRSP